MPKIRIGRLLPQGARLIWPPEIQRWKCRSCGRTFLAKTESAISASKPFATTGATYAKCTLAGMTLKELPFACHVSLKDLVGSMRIRLFEVMQAALQSPRSAHAVCCCQAGSISASRLRATGKGRMCRCPKGAQATAMLCIHAQYRTRRSAQRVPQMTLETNIQRFTGGEGPPDA